MSHRLEDEVWPAFKNMVHDPDLDRYDGVIHAIDMFLGFTISGRYDANGDFDKNRV